MAVLTLVTAVATLVTAVASVIINPGVSWQKWVLGALVAVLAGVAGFSFFIGLHIGPWKLRDFAFKDGLGNTGCTTVLKGTAEVPAGEDVWILLFKDADGSFYIEGNPGPVASGEADGDWTLPLEVSDVYYPNRPTYTVMAVTVPFKESARLRAQPKGEALSPDVAPSEILAAEQGHITLAADQGCKAG